MNPTHASRTDYVPTSSPASLKEMHARKRAADQRQAQAATERERAAREARAAEEQARTEAAAAAEREAQQRAEEDAARMKARQIEEDGRGRDPRIIVNDIAQKHGVEPADIYGESRVAAIVDARREAVGAVRLAWPKRSLPWLGEFFGLDHTTVLHHLRKLGLPTGQANGPTRAMASTTEDEGTRGEGGQRSIRALDVTELTPGGETTEPPRFRTVDPTTLLVDGTYQRNLSDNSRRLIRRIVSEWSWRAYKPPVVVEVDGALHVIDGQHTAIAAATHPDIAEIPVMIVTAERREDRADAFVRHNRDRTQMTGTQMHFGLVAAGNEDALTLQLVCERAGATILRSNPKRYQVGDTIAVEVLRALVRRRHAKGAREVLETCVKAGLAPISASALRAVETLLFEPEHAGSFAPEALTATLQNLGAAADRQAALVSAEHQVPRWRGLAIVLARNTKKVRRPAAPAVTEAA